MSKVGKKFIDIPKGVEVKVSGSLISAKGAKGELSREFPDLLSVSVADGKINITLKGEVADSGKKHKVAFMTWGLFRALINNMVKGVSDGFEKGLLFEGVGYKAAVKGNDLELNLGYSHPISIKAPQGITFKVEKSSIKVIGIDKELVGHVAAEIRSKRLPEPYQGSGIRYEDEIIKKKAGKKAAAA